MDVRGDVVNGIRRKMWVVALGAAVLLVAGAFLASAGKPRPGGAPLGDMEPPQVTDPGPGRGAYVVYNTADGTIVTLVGYDLNQPVSPILDAGQAALDVTGNMNLQAMFDDYRSGQYGAANPYPWYVNPATQEVMHF